MSSSDSSMDVSMFLASPAGESDITDITSAESSTSSGRTPSSGGTSGPGSPWSSSSNSNSTTSSSGATSMSTSDTSNEWETCPLERERVEKLLLEAANVLSREPRVLSTVIKERRIEQVINEIVKLFGKGFFSSETILW